MSLIKVRGVHKSFKDEKTVRALRGVTFQLEKGEHLFVLGETGSGKSTLLKCLAGIYDLDRGSIRFRGEKLGKPSEQLLSGTEGIRLVEQEYGLHPYLTVNQTILQMMPPQWRKKDQQERLKFLLWLFDLRKKGSKKPGELSGGQQQRLAMARSFAQIPDLLLLDEPFAHLDPQMKNRLFEYLEFELDQKNLAIVTVTHDYKEALKNADRIMILEKGKVVQEDAPSELYRSPVNLYAAGLLGEYNIIELSGKKAFHRPEDLSLTTKGKGDMDLNVIRQKFCGHYSEVYLSHNKDEVTIISGPDKQFKRGDVVGVKSKIPSPLLLDDDGDSFKTASL
jgi:iron(III) transport system ATP-binding protein